MAMKHVLVVEDDISYRPFWEAVLNESYAPYELDWETTENGAETLLRDAFRNNRPYDLVISDVLLADADTGVELWRRYGESTGRFVLVSGMGKSEFENMVAKDSNKNLSQPVFLEKPLSAQKCKQMVRDISAGGTHESVRVSNDGQ